MCENNDERSASVVSLKVCLCQLLVPQLSSLHLLPSRPPVHPLCPRTSHSYLHQQRLQRQQFLLRHPPQHRVQHCQVVKQRPGRRKGVMLGGGRAGGSEGERSRLKERESPLDLAHAFRQGREGGGGWRWHGTIFVWRAEGKGKGRKGGKKEGEWVEQ